MKRIAERAVPAGYLGVVGLFLMVRLKAFFMVGFGRELPLWSLGAGVLVCLVLGALFAPAVGKFYKTQCLPPVPARIVTGLSLLMMLPLRGILLGRALEGSGMGVGRLTGLLYLIGAGLLLSIFLQATLRALWQGRRGIKAFLRSLRLRDGVFLLGLLLILNLLLLLYARHSSVIYIWDNAGYWTQSHALVALWKESGTAELLRQVYDSILVSDYNHLAALPAAAMTAAFGKSRYVFQAAILNFGYFPLMLCVWALGKTTAKRPIVATLGVLLSLPVAFSTVLDGFVDVGGCVFPFLALLLWRWDRGRSDFGRFLLAGIFLALGLLIRRWYAFYATAFLLALGVDCLVFRRSAAPILGGLCGFAFTLLYPFQPLVSTKLLADYGSMYAAYDLGLKTDFLLICYRFGLLVLLAALGIGIWCLARRSRRQLGLFCLLTGGICFFLFVRVQTHGQQHLLLYIPVLAALLMEGIDALADLGGRRTVALALALSMLPSLGPALPGKRPGGIGEIGWPRPVPMFSWRPGHNPDADTMVELVRHLDTYGEQGLQVGILASSLRFNLDVLLNAELSLSLPRVSEVDRGYLAILPQVDQRDGWHDTVFDCDILVTSDPVALHLGEENQQVVALPARALLEGTGFGAAYEPLPETWTLSDGTVICIYRRTRAVTEEEKEAVRQAFYAAHPEMVSD